MRAARSVENTSGGRLMATARWATADYAGLRSVVQRLHLAPRGVPGRRGRATAGHRRAAARRIDDDASTALPRREVGIEPVLRARKQHVVREDRRGEVDRVEHDADRRHAATAAAGADGLEIVDEDVEREVLLAT